MSRRFPAIPLDQQPEDMKEYAKFFDDTAAPRFGPNGDLMVYRDENGGLIGPFPVLIASKSVGYNLMYTFTKFPEFQGLPDDAKEVVILITGAKFQCNYERYAHIEHAFKQAGISRSQAEVLAEGQKPEGLSAPANVAFDAAYHLVFKAGPLPDQIYDKCVETFGKDGTLSLTHYVAMYCAVCVLMNVADAPAPEGKYAKK